MTDYPPIFATLNTGEVIRFKDETLATLETRIWSARQHRIFLADAEGERIDPFAIVRIRV